MAWCQKPKNDIHDSFLLIGEIYDKKYKRKIVQNYIIFIRDLKYLTEFMLRIHNEKIIVDNAEDDFLYRKSINLLK